MPLLSEGFPVRSDLPPINPVFLFPFGFSDRKRIAFDKLPLMPIRVNPTSFTGRIESGDLRGRKVPTGSAEVLA